MVIEKVNTVQSAKVLLVDDSNANCIDAKAIIENYGCTCEIAFSAVDALNRINDLQPELIITDIGMPDVDGILFCERLKADESLREIPVIFLTASTDIETLSRAFEAGGSDFLVKPLQAIEFENRAQFHINQYRIRKSSNTRIDSLGKRANALSNFLVSATRELRDPLVSIKDMSTQFQALGEEDLNELQNELIAAIQQSSDSMLELVEELLEISRFETDLRAVEVSPHDIDPILRLAIALHSARANKKDITLSYKPNRLPTKTLANKQLITRIVDNITSNAIKFSKRGTSVSVSLEYTDSATIIDFDDEGPGIKKEDLNLLFKEFGKTSNQPTEGEASHGLGLYACKKMIEAMNGEITVTNRHPRGTRFRVILPSATTGGQN